jgi:hypothetical protein
MGWGSGALAVGCLAVGVMHLVRLAMVRRDVVGEASHVAMALGMAAMSSPLGDPVPEPVWTGVFAATAAWFGAVVLRSGDSGDEPGHHVVGSVAMLFMLAADHPTGHEAHVAPAMPGIAPVAAMAFAGYFAWHVLRCADRCRTTVPVAAGGAPAGSAAGSMAPPAFSLRAPQTAAAGDLVLAAAMAAMLLGML